MLYRLFFFGMALIASAYASDFERESYFKQSCAQNDAQACLALGAMYHVGDGVAQSFKKAREYYAKSCELGLAAGCTHLGYMYENGHAGYHPDQAAKLYTQACDLNDYDACESLGKFYENGTGVGEDMQKAVDYYDKACEGGKGRSCTHLGLLYEQDGNDAYARIYYQKACDLNEADICTNLGIWYLNGKGVKVDEKKAYQLFQQACSLGDENGCKNYEAMKNANWF
jgi:hypothetical protein